MIRYCTTHVLSAVIDLICCFAIEDHLTCDIRRDVAFGFTHSIIHGIFDAEVPDDVADDGRTNWRG